MQAFLTYENAKTGQKIYTLVAGHSSVLIVDLERALVAGWNVRRLTEQGPDDWEDMSAGRIAQWISFNRPDARLIDEQECSRVLAAVQSFRSR